MCVHEKFHIKARQLLMELNASVSKIMMMVAIGEMDGAFWEEATLRHRDAFTAWDGFLSAHGHKLSKKIVVH